MTKLTEELQLLEETRISLVNDLFDESKDFIQPHNPIPIPHSGIISLRPLTLPTVVEAS